MKIKEWFNKFKKQVVPEESEEKKLLEQMCNKIFFDRINIDQFQSEFEFNGSKYFVDFIQLYKGSDWYQFVCTEKNMNIEFDSKKFHPNSNNKIISIIVADNEENKYFEGCTFHLDYGDTPYKCTITDIIRDNCGNIFMKIEKEQIYKLIKDEQDDNCY